MFHVNIRFYKQLGRLLAEKDDGLADHRILLDVDED